MTIMEKNNLIPANEFCKFNGVEISFILWLDHAGLISAVQQDDLYIQEQELAKVERLMRLHYELEINYEGLETIDHLLENIQHLQEEVKNLQNKLSRFSDDF